MAAWTHPDVSLGELVEQAAAFLDILILASGYQSDGSLALWSQQSLRKALGWAGYLEQVLQKLPQGKEGEASRLALESALDALLAAVPLPPGISGFSLSMLANARSLLVRVLLEALPIQISCLVAEFVESDEQSGDLWEEVIRTLSERCLAFGSVKSLQQVVDQTAGACKLGTEKEPRVEIWKESSSTRGVKPPSERWAKEGLKYITSAETMHKLAGATLIFKASREEWTQVLDSLRHQQAGRRETEAQIAELCCLFLASSRWSELPRRLLHPGRRVFRDQSSERYTDCWVGRNWADSQVRQEVICPKVREEVEEYLQQLPDSGTLWWTLAPILPAVVLTKSVSLQSYIQLIETRIANTSTETCSSDCSCQICCHRSDGKERAWCLLILLDGHHDSDVAKQLHGMLGMSALEEIVVTMLHNGTF